MTTIVNEMTTTQLIDGINSGEIKIAKSPALSDYKNLKGKVLDEIQNRHKWYLNVLEKHPPEHDFEKKQLKTEGLVIFEDGQVSFGPCIQLLVHSFILGYDLYAFLHDNTIYFKKFNPGNMRTVDGKLTLDTRSTYSVPNVPKHIHGPIKGSFPIPSKKLVIANFFSREEPDDVKYGHEYDICCTRGRHNLAKYMNEKGYGYGQTGNICVYVYANKKEILLIDTYAFSERMSKKLENYIKSNKLKEVGKFSTPMWRWEATDYELAKDDIDSEYHGCDDCVILPIKGTSVSYEHYMGMEKDSPIHKAVIARMTIKDIRD